MKKFFLFLFLISGIGFVVSPSMAYAHPSMAYAHPSMAYAQDWTHGTAYFYGRQPEHCTSIGGVLIYYNGWFEPDYFGGGVDYYKCTGDVCIIFPKNYSGRPIRVNTPGTVQVQYLK